MYKFYNAGRKTICVSSYAGKPVRGVAKCSDDDEFDVDFGRKLALARCNVKVAEKRLQRARTEKMKAEEAVRLADFRLKDMTAYEWEAEIALKYAKKDLQKLETR